jgi:hypothetical protein
MDFLLGFCEFGRWCVLAVDDRFCPCFDGCFSLNLKLGYGVLVFWWELAEWVTLMAFLCLAGCVYESWLWVSIG